MKKHVPGKSESATQIIHELNDPKQEDLELIPGKLYRCIATFYSYRGLKPEEEWRDFLSRSPNSAWKCTSGRILMYVQSFPLLHFEDKGKYIVHTFLSSDMGVGGLVLKNGGEFEIENYIEAIEEEQCH